MASPSKAPGAPVPAARSSRSPVHWEERSASRVLEAGRDQILERSRKLVEAAYELLADEGLDGLTVRAVLQKTRLSRRAFYERFAGKDDLMLAVFEETIRRAASHYRMQSQHLSDPMARLQLIIQSIATGRSAADDAGSDHRERRGAALSREHLRLAESHPQDLQAAIRPLIALIAEVLAAGMAAGRVRKGDPARLALFIYNLLSTTVHAELLAGEANPSDPVQRQRLAEEIWDFCRRAIAP